ncbi:MAG: response regulator [Desulfobacterales bacterium]|nr:response regulator [Desulfobacterales bacterium]
MTNTIDSISILVVDDERDIRDGSERILSKMGCTVFKADRGNRGLEILKSNPVALVLLDMKMPGMDGMEVLKLIRRDHPEILVVVITGFATIETAIEAMKEGAYDFIPKPFEPAQLRIVVNRAWEKIRLSAEAQLLAAERQRTLVDLDTEKSRVHTILESLPSGTAVTDNDGQVVLMNPAFKRDLGIDSDLPLGKLIGDYISDPGLNELVMDISRGRHVDYDDIPVYEFSLPNNKFFMVAGRPVLGENNACLGAVISIADISAMKTLDQLKSEFVAKVSHELRSPLSTIHEQLAVVIGDMVEVAPENDKLILARAKEKTFGLISLISDLLDLSRIEEGAICQDIRNIQVDALLESIVDFLKTRSDAKNQALTLELGQADLPEITADAIALESIFGNLITNAINYTPADGRITVKVDMAGINIRVQINDNGFGIEAKHLENIFDRFYRVKNEKTRYITGTGLGLPIVKELVSAMGGMVDVESTPDQGSTFTVLLPTAGQ